MRRHFSRLLHSLILLLALVIILLFIGALRSPTDSLHGMLGSALWTTLAPHFLLLSLTGCLFIWWWRRRYPKTHLSTLTLSAAVAAAISSGVVCYQFKQTAVKAGGDINWRQALLLKSITAAKPDLMLSYDGYNGIAKPLALFLPSNPGAKAPVLLYIHGGGFMAGSLLETSNDLRWFADRGYLVVSAGYSLFSEDNPSWQKAPQDVACALSWLKDNAARYGGDINRLALLGDSAGGNLALNMAYGGAMQAEQAHCDTAPPAVTAVVVQYPAVDPLAIYEYGYPIPGFAPKMLVSGYIGGDPYQLAQRISAVSSYSYLSAQAPATLIFSPRQDGLVPAWTVQRFASYARLAGVELELVSIPFANHVYNQLAANSVGNQLRRSVTLRYLRQQGVAETII
ncbi:alpha/beta hydrolase [Rheinheimera pleomorphica]|uniref:alpha/beta hydrolase n=1 Tax=Rheinheimera pleomorphica TaxID=2703963 RepID=UPI0014227FC7|nr:alpha/beta hydrolase [Rheinheimera pleomorphica]